MEVRWHGPDDVATFAELAWPLLDADPVRHTLALTTLHGLTHQASSRAAGAMVTVHDGARTVGALVCSAGRPAIVSAVRADQAAAVDRLLATADPALPGAIGPVREVEAFVAEHTARSGASVRVGRRMRLFVLDELAAPKGVAGTARTATPDDMDLIDDWIDEFRIETSQQRDPVPRAPESGRPPILVTRGGSGRSAASRLRWPWPGRRWRGCLGSGRSTHRSGTANTVTAPP